MLSDLRLCDEVTVRCKESHLQEVDSLDISLAFEVRWVAQCFTKDADLVELLIQLVVDAPAESNGPGERVDPVDFRQVFKDLLALHFIIRQVNHEALVLIV